MSDSEYRIMCCPTSHLPGTEGKIRELARRFKNNERLHHPMDARIPKGEFPDSEGPVPGFGVDIGRNDESARYKAWLERLDGMIQNEQPARRVIPKWKVTLPGGEFTIVVAYTKGEARTAAKVEFKLDLRKRLPPGTVVEQVDQ